ncbi:MAG: imidazole glycerol phosphate synthase subunit HisH [Candidatus Brockarchaeota archaeon]|nr:imidazole glycerol phosphate synthase subunit HisH [Candidatus Brockarchaeota archaeon]
MRIMILDCGVGNLASISASLKKVGAEPRIVSSIVLEEGFDGLVIPGVGSYSAAFKKVDEERRRIMSIVEKGRPVLGICLGLQLMFNGSEEGKQGEEGLGFFRGFVKKIPVKRLPHIGWNSIEITGKSLILKGLENNSYMYFAHSYAPLDYAEDDAAAYARYGGIRFPVVFEKENVFGVQFHPEKSWQPGLRILRNFLSLCGGGTIV